MGQIRANVRKLNKADVGAMHRIAQAHILLSQAEEKLVGCIRAARKAGVTWAVIAVGLEMSEPTAYSKYGPRSRWEIR
jgi:hypothetical protein